MSRIATLFAVTAFVALSPSASASPRLSPFPSSLPAQCVPLSLVPRSATIALPNIAAHVSVANCLAETAMNGAMITPDSSSVARLNDAVRPSLAMLDEVIALRDPYWTAIAEDAKRDLFESLVVRERVSALIPDLTLETALMPWQERAKESRDAIAKVIHDQPSIASRDAVIANVVRDTERTDARVAHAK